MICICETKFNYFSRGESETLMKSVNWKSRGYFGYHTMCYPLFKQQREEEPGPFLFLAYTKYLFMLFIIAISNFQLSALKCNLNSGV